MKYTWLPNVAFVLSGMWGIIEVCGSWKVGMISVGKNVNKCSEYSRDSLCPSCPLKNTRPSALYHRYHNRDALKQQWAFSLRDL